MTKDNLISSEVYDRPPLLNMGDISRHINISEKELISSVAPEHEANLAGILHGSMLFPYAVPLAKQICEREFGKSHVTIDIYIAISPLDKLNTAFLKNHPEYNQTIRAALYEFSDWKTIHMESKFPLIRITNHLREFLESTYWL